MKRAWIATLLLIAGCSESKEDCKDACCQKPGAPAAPVVMRDISRGDGILLTGLPDSPELAAIDALGRWGVKTAVIEHSLEDPKEKAPLLPQESKPKITLYRDTLPFPEVNWKSGDWEVTQLVFPLGKGYVARYHVMNHGEAAREGHLKVGARNAAEGSQAQTIAAAGKPAAASLTFDFKCEPGVSQFFNVTTADLAGVVPDDALDQVTAQWEKLYGNRALKLPDPAAETEYCSNLAGQLLGVKGCTEATAKTEQMLAKVEGKALRLLGGIPEKWTLEAIEAREIPTEFGPLSFKYQGAYNNRTYELKPGCAPPDGYIVAVPAKLVARIDGKDAPATAGLLKVPATAKFVEVSYPR